ncbi:hypothetical protein B4U80_07302, partial [Leptotrombidium deliense]
MSTTLSRLGKPEEIAN